MKALIQRVKSAHVVVGDKLVGQIGVGVLAYVGIGRDDDFTHACKLIDKILSYRIFENTTDSDKLGKMDKSVADVGGIKLGAGGLTRAYATATQMVVDKMVLVPFIPKSVLKVVCSFAHEAQVRYLIGQVKGEILSADYAHDVVMMVQIDSEKATEFAEHLGIYSKIQNT